MYKRVIFILIKLVAIIAIGLSFVQVNAATSLNGVAVHSELQKEQFIAGLYLTTQSDSAKSILSANEEKELQIRVLANAISSRKFKRMWIEGMAINANNKELSAQSANMANFSNMLKITLIKGDIFTLNRTKKNVVVQLNGVTIGTIPNPNFFDMLSRTFIGSVPLSSDFRSKLLAAGNLETDVAVRFQNTQPSTTRIATVTTGVKQLLEQTGGTTIASAPTQIKPAAPKKPTVKKTAKPKPKATVKSKPKATAKPKPKPKPKATAVPAAPAIPQESLIDDSIFAIEEDDVEYTAETLLSQQLYISKLKKWSQRFLKYPVTATKRNQQGTVRIGLTVDRFGKAKKVTVIEASKYSVLTREAKNAVKRAEPYPRMPADMPGEEFSFTIPIAFKIVDG